VTFTATVTGSGGTPTGTVQFAVDGTNTGSPMNVTTSGGVTTASFSTNMLTVAGSPHTISASYSGDPNFAGSSGSVSETVNKANTSTVLNSSLNPSSAGQPVTFTATVSPVPPGAGAPGGSVQFAIDGSNFGGPV